MLLAGDAQALVNPLTGEGIYYAVLSGCAGRRGGADTGPAPGAAYRRTLRRRLGRYLRQPRRWLRRVAGHVLDGRGCRGGGRDAQVFDDVVELGLVDGQLTGRAAAPDRRSSSGGYSSVD